MMAARARRQPTASRLLATGAALLALLPALAQSPPPATAPEAEVFSGETTVVAVEVPVQVLVRGEPVRGLTAADFRLYEGDEPRELTGFEVVDLTVTPGGGAAAEAAPGATDAPPAASVPPAGRRNFLLFFDLSFTQLGHLYRGIEGARGLLRSGLHPSDLVGVAFYHDRRGANVVLQFTPDRAQVATVLDAFESLLEGRRQRAGAGAGDAGGGDPLGLTAGGWSSALVEIGHAAGVHQSDAAEALAATGGVTSGPGGLYADNILQHMSKVMAQSVREQQGAQIGYFTDAVRELTEELRSVEGPKHLVLMSAGYNASLVNPMTALDPYWKGVGLGGGSVIMRDMHEMVRDLRRSGWVLHAASLSGLAAPAAFREGLFYFAEETGGLLIERTNDVSVGMPEILERTSVTYVLTFQTGEVATDGAFHPIRVELANGPRGARLVHRTGYHAPGPEAERDARALRASAAARILAGKEVSGFPVGLAATALRYTGGRAQVPVLVEIADPALLAPGAGDAAPVEIYIYAFDASGAIADFIAQSVTPPAASGAGEEAPLRGLKVTGELDLAPGHYELRALARSVANGREAVRTAALEVPAADPDAGPRLLPPLFVQAPDERWVMAEVGAGEGPGAFAVEGRRIAPAAVPALPAGGAARLLLPGMGIAAEAVRVETRILDRAGAPAAAGRLVILGRRAPAEGQPDLLVGRLDTSGLAPGDYALEVAIAGTGQRVRAAFRVVG